MLHTNRQGNPYSFTIGNSMRRILSIDVKAHARFAITLFFVVNTSTMCLHRNAFVGILVPSRVQHSTYAHTNIKPMTQIQQSYILLLYVTTTSEGIPMNHLPYIYWWVNWNFLTAYFASVLFHCLMFYIYIY